jgi:hypothetical protein
MDSSRFRTPLAFAVFGAFLSGLPFDVSACAGGRTRDNGAVLLPQGEERSRRTLAPFPSAHGLTPSPRPELAFTLAMSH